MAEKRKRPQGRKKYVTESDKEAKRRDDQGLGTGPVGEGREDSPQSEEDKGLVDGLLGLLGDNPTGSSGQQGGNSLGGDLLGGLLGGGNSNQGNQQQQGGNSLGGSLLNGLLGGGNSNQGNQQQQGGNSLGGSLLNGLLGGGSNQSSQQQNQTPNFVPLGGSSNNNQNSGGGGGFKIGKWLIIILILMFLFGGGRNLFSNLLGGLFGGGGSSSGGYDFGITDNAVQNITGGTTDTTTWQEETAEQEVDTTVLTGVRDKYTTIKGGKKDKVTIMIYMCGTDLESRSGMATRDLIEMCNANLQDNVSIIVYTGGCKKWQNQNISSSTNQIYKVVKGGLQPLEMDMGNKSMVDPATLTTFINYCTKNFPANRQELILWDHGGGSVQGYGYDEKNVRAGSMSLAGVNEALKNAGTKFDFIGFDACLMATVETGLMLDDFADYMIASEETEPGVGWYYTDWLTALCNDPSMSTVDIGKNIVDSFVETCAKTCRGQSATLSVVDLAELSYSAPDTLKSFSKSLSKMIKNKEYTQISDARNSTREFARSTQIDQVDLVHFAKNIGNKEGTKLAEALQGAVKYNRTSSDMSNSYGISIYFPYRSASSVDSAVNTYNAIGMDSSYSDAIREFASLEVCGQAAAGGYDSMFGSLLGGLTGGSSGAAGPDMIGSLLGGFLGGDYSSLLGLGGKNTAFLKERSLTDDEITEYITANFFDATKLVWQKNDAGETVITLTEDQWELVEGLEQGMFYDDGAGYMDMGRDNVFTFNDAGELVAETDFTWVAVNGQPVAYYHDYTSGDEIHGHIPALLNGQRVELLTVIDGNTGKGEVVGARVVYTEDETETVAKSYDPLADGDTIDFICDYYTYEGEYQDSYFIGDTMTVSGTPEITNVRMGDGNARVNYRFTDIYQQHYWTPAVDFPQAAKDDAADDASSVPSAAEEADAASVSVEESGTYTTPEEVAAYIHEFGHLPDNFITKREAMELGWDSSLGNLDEVAPGMSIGGDRFGNYEGQLPTNTRYTECDVNYEGGYRGGERIVFGKNGAIYYTDDHYETFTQLY